MKPVKTNGTPILHKVVGSGFDESLHILSRLAFYFSSTSQVFQLLQVFSSDQDVAPSQIQKRGVFGIHNTESPSHNSKILINRRKPKKTTVEHSARQAVKGRIEGEAHVSPTLLLLMDCLPWQGLN